MPRVAKIGCGMLITIFFFTCIIQNVFSAHLGKYSMQRRSAADSSSSRNQETENAMPQSQPSRTQEREVPVAAVTSKESSTELPFPSIPLEMSSFGARLPQPSTPNVNLFEEYMSRGLYTCTSSYLDALGKLHALIAEVYADYQNCQKLIKTTPKTFSRTDIDALDDMLDEWEKEDAAAAAAGSSTNSASSVQQSQEAERREEDIAVPAVADLPTSEDSTASKMSSSSSS